MNATVVSMEPEADAPVAYVGFWARVAASLIDTVIVLFLAVPVSLFLFGDGWTRNDGFAAFTVNWILPGIAVVLFWLARAATPGKMVISAVIVDAAHLGAPTPWQFITRYVGYFVSTIPLGLGLLWVAFDRRKQGWHDKMANTVVIYRRR